MAARPERYHQDYIARIRYSNALPPPPNPPKLLDIPNTGLSSGQYTSAGFASRLAREQPLNIEADAELGMPIDLIGLPGVFEGDESAIQAHSSPPQLHEKDRALLRPLSTLGKSAPGTTAVSFLRRTEYLTGASTPSGGNKASNDIFRNRNQGAANRVRRKPDVNKDNPLNIMRDIVKGFDLAYPRDAYKGPDTTTQIRGTQPTPAEVDAWKNPKHPSRPELKLLDAYPVLPDFEAVPEMGAYLVMKFQTNPVPVTERYDDRLDVAFFRPLGESTAVAQEESQLKAWDYRLFLPGSHAVAGIKRKFSVIDPDKDDEDLYTDTNAEGTGKVFKYEQIRAYETYQQAGQLGNEFGETVALALNDGEGGRLQKGAYYYPISQRTFIRARRGNQKDEQEEGMIDVAEVTVRDVNEEEGERMREKRAAWDISAEV